jgi:hypothetical protein
MVILGADDAGSIQGAATSSVLTSMDAGDQGLELFN